LATLKEIRIRITAVKSIQKITKAMKMVAAAKLKKAQDRILSTRPYAAKLNELFSHVISVTDITWEKRRRTEYCQPDLMPQN
jgi:F-type H+-transporting ATPase subunit gamma